MPVNRRLWWGDWLQPGRHTCMSFCRLCGWRNDDTDPVSAIRKHLAEAHGTTTPTDERERIAGPVSLDDTSPLLSTMLRALGDEFGPAGVLGAAMQLAHPAAHGTTTPTTVSTDVRAARSIYDGTRWGR